MSVGVVRPSCRVVGLGCVEWVCSKCLLFGSPSGLPAQPRNLVPLVPKRRSISPLLFFVTATCSKVAKEILLPRIKRLTSSFFQQVEAFRMFDLDSANCGQGPTIFNFTPVVELTVSLDDHSHRCVLQFPVLWTLCGGFCWRGIFLSGFIAIEFQGFFFSLGRHLHAEFVFLISLSRW